ncbi:putative holin-like toxin [Anaerotignum faecicola]|nr:putative holin-like toxin [Anaerotignum faecicola]
MSTYEALMSMFTFALVLLALLSYIDNKRK